MQARGARTARTPIAAAALGAVAVLAGGCGSTRHSHQPSGGPARTAKVAAKSIIAAADRLQNAPALSIELTSVTSVNGASQRATGSFNYRTHKSSQRIVTSGGNTPAPQDGRPVRAIATPSLLYLRLPAALTKSLPRPWLALTAAQYNHDFGVHGGLEAISSPFSYGNAGAPDAFAQFLRTGAASFITAGSATVDGVATQVFRGRSGPITLSLTTAAHRTITETYRRLALTLWLDRAGRVRRISMHSTAPDRSTIAEQFTVTAWSAGRIAAPPAAEVTASGG